jgi:hypothetical protein
MSSLRLSLKRSSLPFLLVLCLAALSVSYVHADEAARPRALQIIGDPDAAVTGRFAVGTLSIGSKALTVVGVIDFLGAGTVHNYFTQGAGNNMQINTNVDEANVVGDASRSQWKLVLGSNLDWFSIRRSPAGGTYNEDALFFIQGSTGNVGIATVDTDNGAAIPFTPTARLHVETEGDAIRGISTATGGSTYGVYGESAATSGFGVLGFTSAATGPNYGVYGWSYSTSGFGVFGYASATAGTNYGVYGASNSPDGRGVYGYATAITGANFGVRGTSASTEGTGVFGYAAASTGSTYGVFGWSSSTSGRGVLGLAYTTTGVNMGVYGATNSPSGYGVYGSAGATTGTNYGVYGRTNSNSGYGVYFVGGLAGTGTKSAIVETQDHGWRTLYTIESPQNWFEDFGQASLVSGEAIVPIEPVFAQTVNLDRPYHVFLTPLGDCGLYVAEQTATFFTVRALNGAACDVAFDYRIVAPRLGYEDLRLEPAEDPEAVASAAATAAAVPEIE